MRAKRRFRVSQIVIEPVLKKAVDASDLIDVRFGTAFERLVGQDDDGVTCEIRDDTGKRSSSGVHIWSAAMAAAAGYDASSVSSPHRQNR